MNVKSILLSNITTNKTYSGGAFRFFQDSEEVYNVGSPANVSSDIAPYTIKYKFDGEYGVNIYASYQYDSRIFSVYQMLYQAGDPSVFIDNSYGFAGNCSDILVTFDEGLEIRYFDFYPNKNSDNKTTKSCKITITSMEGYAQTEEFDINDMANSTYNRYVLEYGRNYENTYQYIMTASGNNFTNISNVEKIVPNCSCETDTIIKFAISFDNKNTWKIFNSNWETLDISDLNLAMEKAMTYEQIKSINYNDYQRIFLSGNIDLLAILKTNNENFTSALNGYRIFTKNTL